MSALITHALDEELEILLIARSSKFSHFLVRKIQDQAAIRVRLIDPREFGEEKDTNKNWYKVVLLFEDLLASSSSNVDEFCFLPDKTIIIMPLTTAIKTDSTMSRGWSEQIEAETVLFNNLIKKIDQSMFLFYKDLVLATSVWFGFFFNEFHRGLLIDPKVELRLQSIEVLTTKLAALTLQPRREPAIIGGKKRISSVFLQGIKKLYSSQYQFNLPIKKVELGIITHPIIKLLIKFSDFNTNEKITDICKEIMAFTPQPHQAQTSSSANKATQQLPPPTRKKLNSKTSTSSITHQIIRLDLEHDLDHLETKVATDHVSVARQTGEKDSHLIENLFKSYRTQQKQQHLQQLTQKTRVGFRKLKGQKFLFGGGVLVSIIAASVLISAVVFLVSLSRVQSSLLDYLKSYGASTAAQQQKTVVLNKTVNSLEGKLALVNQWFPIPLFSKPLQLIEVSHLIVDLQQQASELETATATFFNQIMTQEGGGSIESVRQESSRVFETLSLLSAELKNYSLDKLSPAQSSLIIDYQRWVGDQEKKNNQFQQLAPILPTLLAEDGTKTYALVLQNNQELRPTGGFVQAVALLTFKDGSLINFQVEDVYSLDQQLKAIVTPPSEVKQFLGEERWFLRDSNWNPDFPSSAKQIKWFLEKSVATRIDGVIGINLKVLKDILAVLDRIELDEYNEVLTKRNLSERMEFHSEVQLEETTQKRDYTELVLSKILSKIQSLPTDQVTPFLSSLAEMADTKELLISIFDPNLATTFKSLGWDGSIIEPTCPTIFKSGECLVDNFMQVEANVGVNKANYYLERQIDHSILITTSQISHKRVITFKNKAQTNAWPKGPYKSYIRFYLPQESDFKDIKINGQSINLNEISIKEVASRKVVGVVIEVAVKSELKLQLEYSLPHQHQTPFTYAFFDQKQPGARDVSPRIFMSYEPDLSPTLIAPQAEVEGEVIVFNPSKDHGHVFVGVSFE